MGLSIFTCDGLLLVPLCVSEDELYTQELLLLTNNGSLDLGVVGSDEFPDFLILVGLGLVPLQERIGYILNKKLL